MALISGDSPMNAKGFFLAVDRTLCSGKIINFARALAILFASFYIFNIKYPTESGSTLEFLQR
jgi:hypothetical protein